ncbi:MAG: (2Fe-2S)-binding protein [Nitratireductor sp.]|nr:(2Fe-2S)-binding protein [Nitratireductor sp.]
MIVCQCNIITRSEIEEVVHGFLDQDAWQLITVGKVYHAMEKRGKCCGCFPNAIAIIVECVEAWHRRHETPEAELLVFVARTRDVLGRQEKQRAEARSAVSARRAA